MEHTWRILIADDHPLIREGLVRIIQQQGAYAVSDQAADGAEALELLRSRRPDIAILDVEMPKMSGIEVARAVHREGLATDLVLLTMHRDLAYFNAAFDLGVRGYLLKDAVVNELVECLASVCSGRYYVSPSISHLLIERRKRMEGMSPSGSPVSRLTPAERHILRLLAENLTSREIAERLSVSPRTVENHRLRICQKLELSGHHRLLQFALEHRQDL